MLAKSEQQSGAEYEPRQHVQESLRGRLDQEKRTGQAAENAGQNERNHYAARNVQLLGISAAARGGSQPQGESVGGVGGNRRNSSEQESRESDEASAARDSVDPATEGAGEKQEDGGVRIQTEVLPRTRLLRQRA